MSIYLLNDLCEKKLNIISIGSWPTPVDILENESINPNYRLLIKRDDLSSVDFGGNKIRKLELLLPKIPESSTVITGGAIGSHHLLATSIYAKKIRDSKVIALTCSQPLNEHVKNNYNLLKKIAYKVIDTDSQAKLAINLFKQKAINPKSYIIPPGASTPLTTIGYIVGLLELIFQLEKIGKILPKRIYVPLGSGGTAAGILAGIWLMNIPIKVIGVKVTQHITTKKNYVISLARLSIEFLKYFHKLKQKKINYNYDLLEVEERFLGQGYGFSSAASRNCIDLFNNIKILNHTLKLEETYTAKTMAALLYRERDKKDNVLYWHTAPRKTIRPDDQ